MDSFSDIVVLFSKLPYDATQYKETGYFQEFNRGGSRWVLVEEIFRSTNQARSEVSDKK